MQQEEVTLLFEKFQNVEGVYEGSYQGMMDYSTNMRIDDLTASFRQMVDSGTTNDMMDLPLDVQFLEDRVYMKRHKEIIKLNKADQ